MRTRYLALILLAAAIFTSSAAYAQDAAATVKNGVNLYYFHGNARCVNCYNMEKWMKELMETSFKNEVDAGKLTFRIINTDEKDNAHFMTDYGLYTKSVVLALVKDGKQVKFENMSKIWDVLRSKDKFSQYIKEGIERYLKEL